MPLIPIEDPTNDETMAEHTCIGLKGLVPWAAVASRRFWATALLIVQPERISAVVHHVVLYQVAGGR